jgi:hypothetical protein
MTADLPIESLRNLGPKSGQFRRAGACMPGMLARGEAIHGTIPSHSYLQDAFEAATDQHERLC